MSTAWWVLVCAAAGLLGYGVALLHDASRRDPVEELPRGAAYLTLPLTGLAGRHLRAGLTPESAAKAVRHLRVVLGTAGLAITSTDRVLAWDSAGDHSHPVGIPSAGDGEGPGDRARPDDREYCGARAETGARALAAGRSCGAGWPDMGVRPRDGRTCGGGPDGALGGGGQGRDGGGTRHGDPARGDGRAWADGVAGDDDQGPDGGRAGHAGRGLSDGRAWADGAADGETRGGARRAGGGQRRAAQARSGPTRSGPARNGPARNGQTRNSPARSGQARNGQARRRAGAARDGGPGWAHPPEEVVLGHVRSVLNGGRAHIVTRDRAGCGAPGCPMRAAVVVPLTVGGSVVGALAAYDAHADAGLLRVADELGRLVSGQLELAELDVCRSRVAEAEFNALTAQISPHFVYNSLTAIASFVRTDPSRARELLLDFADFARYALRRARRFTTLADELGCVDRYLMLERARFGDRLQCSVRVAPEVLPVPVPFLCLQPIVENAIKHGLRSTDGAGEVRVVVRDAGPEAHITIEDDGVGMDPEKARAMLGGDNPRHGAGGVGLANVDLRLRQIYGPDYGLIVETAPGQGTKVRLRVPKRWNKHSSL
ncbi:histidine kinase [Thermopolyspora sp. NPDC052614]|uniref:histidine kinase n=1 Tax=Thermopolyspora sp. NPDC052614 TaxID=3155682 RepID=UPI0034165E65